MASGHTTDVSQWVEIDVTPHALDNSILFEFSPEVAHDGDHVANEDIEDVENEGSHMGQIQYSIAARRTEKKIHVSPHGSLQI